MGILDKVKSIIKPTPKPAPTNQYSKPIGPQQGQSKAIPGINAPTSGQQNPFKGVSSSNPNVNTNPNFPSTNKVVSSSRGSGGGSSSPAPSNAPVVETVGASNLNVARDVPTVPQISNSVQSFINNQRNQTNQIRNQYDAFPQRIGTPQGVVTPGRDISLEERISRGRGIKSFFTGLRTKADKNINTKNQPTTSLGNTQGQFLPGLETNREGVTTQLDYNKAQARAIAIRDAPQIIKIEAQTKADVLTKVQNDFNNERNQLQQSVYEGTIDIKDATQRQNELQSKYQQVAQEEYKQALASNPTYQNIINRRQKDLGKIGVTKEGPAGFEFEGLNEQQVVNRVIREKSVEALKLTPIGAVGAAVKVGQDQNIIDPETLQQVPFHKQTKRSQAEVLTNLAFGIAPVGSELKAIPKSINTERALQTLNTQLRTKTVQITEESLKTGLVKVPIVDFNTNQPIEVALNIGKRRLQNLKANQLSREAFLESVDDLDTTIKFQRVGTQVEEVKIKDLFTNNFGELTSKQPALSNIRTVNEVGKFERLLPSGKVDKGFVVSGLQEVDGVNQNVAVIFKLTKKGKPTNVNLLTERDLEGIGRVVVPAKKATKAQLPEDIFFPIEGENPIVIKAVDRLKEGKPIKEVTVNQEVTLLNQNPVIRQIERETITLEVAKPSRGTTSIKNFVDSNTPRIVEPTQPKPIARSKSVRKEIITEAEINKQIDNLGKVKIGRRKTTRFVESGESKSIKEAIPFDLIKEKRPEKLNNLYKKESEKINEALDNTPLPVQADNFKPIKLGNFESPVISEIGGIPVSESALFKGGGFTDSEIRGAIKQLTANNPQTRSLTIESLKETPSRNLPSFLQPSSTSNIEPKLEVNNLNQRKIDLLLGSSVLNFNALNNQVINQQQLPKLNINSNDLQVGLQPALELQPNLTPELKRPRSDIPELNYDLPFPVPNLPGFGNQNPQGSKEKKRKNRKKVKVDDAYTASIAAALFQSKPTKVTRKQLKQLDDTVFSGAEIRPVVEIVEDKDVKKAIKKLKL